MERPQEGKEPLQAATSSELGGCQSDSSPTSSIKRPIQLGVVQSTTGNWASTGNQPKKNRWDQAPELKEEEESNQEPIESSSSEQSSQSVKHLIQKFEDISGSSNSTREQEEVVTEKPIKPQTPSRVKLVRTNFMKPNPNNDGCSTTNLDNDIPKNTDVPSTPDSEIKPVSASKALQIISSCYDSPTDESSQEGDNVSSVENKAPADSAYASLEKLNDDINQSEIKSEVFIAPNTAPILSDCNQIERQNILDGTCSVDKDTKQEIISSTEMDSNQPMEVIDEDSNDKIKNNSSLSSCKDNMKEENTSSISISQNVQPMEGDIPLETTSLISQLKVPEIETAEKYTNIDEQSNLNEVQNKSPVTDSSQPVEIVEDSFVRSEINVGLSVHDEYETCSKKSIETRDMSIVEESSSCKLEVSEIKDVSASVKLCSTTEEQSNLNEVQGSSDDIVGHQTIEIIQEELINKLNISSSSSSNNIDNKNSTINEIETKSPQPSDVLVEKESLSYELELLKNKTLNSQVSSSPKEQSNLITAEDGSLDIDACEPMEVIEETPIDEADPKFNLSLSNVENEKSVISPACGIEITEIIETNDTPLENSSTSKLATVAETVNTQNSTSSDEQSNVNPIENIDNVIAQHIVLPSPTSRFPTTQDGVAVELCGEMSPGIAETQNTETENNTQNSVLSENIDMSPGGEHCNKNALEDTQTKEELKPDSNVYFKEDSEVEHEEIASLEETPSQDTKNEAVEGNISPINIVMEEMVKNNKNDGEKVNLNKTVDLDSETILHSLSVDGEIVSGPSSDNRASSSNINVTEESILPSKQQMDNETSLNILSSESAQEKPRDKGSSNIEDTLSCMLGDEQEEPSQLKQSYNDEVDATLEEMFSESLEASESSTDVVKENEGEATTAQSDNLSDQDIQSVSKPESEHDKTENNIETKDSLLEMLESEQSPCASNIENMSEIDGRKLASQTETLEIEEMKQGCSSNELNTFSDRNEVDPNIEITSSSKVGLHMATTVNESSDDTFSNVCRLQSPEKKESEHLVDKGLVETLELHEKDLSETNDILIEGHSGSEHSAPLAETFQQITLKEDKNPISIDDNIEETTTDLQTDLKNKNAVGFNSSQDELKNVPAEMDPTKLEISVATSLSTAANISQTERMEINREESVISNDDTLVNKEGLVKSDSESNSPLLGSEKMPDNCMEVTDMPGDKNQGTLKSNDNFSNVNENKHENQTAPLLGQDNNDKSCSGTTVNIDKSAHEVTVTECIPNILAFEPEDAQQVVDVDNSKKIQDVDCGNIHLDLDVNQESTTTLNDVSNAIEFSLSQTQDEGIVKANEKTTSATPTEYSTEIERNPLQTSTIVEDDNSVQQSCISESSTKSLDNEISIKDTIHQSVDLIPNSNVSGNRNTICEVQDFKSTESKQNIDVEQYSANKTATDSLEHLNIEDVTNNEFSQLNESMQYSTNLVQETKIISEAPTQVQLECNTSTDECSKIIDEEVLNNVDDKRCLDKTEVADTLVVESSDNLPEENQCSTNDITSVPTMEVENNSVAYVKQQTELIVAHDYKNLPGLDSSVESTIVQSCEQKRTCDINPCDPTDEAVTTESCINNKENIICGATTKQESQLLGDSFNSVSSLPTEVNIMKVSNEVADDDKEHEIESIDMASHESTGMDNQTSYDRIAKSSLKELESPVSTSELKSNILEDTEMESSEIIKTHLKSQILCTVADSSKSIDSCNEENKVEHELKVDSDQVPTESSIITDETNIFLSDKNKTVVKPTISSDTVKEGNDNVNLENESVTSALNKLIYESEITENTSKEVDKSDVTVTTNAFKGSDKSDTEQFVQLSCSQELQCEVPQIEPSETVSNLSLGPSNSNQLENENKSCETNKTEELTSNLEFKESHNLVEKLCVRESIITESPTIPDSAKNTTTHITQITDIVAENIQSTSTISTDSDKLKDIKENVTPPTESVKYVSPNDPPEVTTVNTTEISTLELGLLDDKKGFELITSSNEKTSVALIKTAQIDEEISNVKLAEPANSKKENLSNDELNEPRIVPTSSPEKCVEKTQPDEVTVHQDGKNERKLQSVKVAVQTPPSTSLTIPHKKTEMEAIIVKSTEIQTKMSSADINETGLQKEKINEFPPCPESSTKLQEIPTDAKPTQIKTKKLETEIIKSELLGKGLLINESTSTFKTSPKKLQEKSTDVKPLMITRKFEVDTIQKELQTEEPTKPNTPTNLQEKSTVVKDTEMQSRKCETDIEKEVQGKEVSESTLCSKTPETLLEKPVDVKLNKILAGKCEKDIEKDTQGEKLNETKPCPKTPFKKSQETSTGVKPNEIQSSTSEAEIVQKELQTEKVIEPTSGLQTPETPKEKSTDLKSVKMQTMESKVTTIQNKLLKEEVNKSISPIPMDEENKVADSKLTISDNNDTGLIACKGNKSTDDVQKTNDNSTKSLALDGSKDCDNTDNKLRNKRQSPDDEEKQIDSGTDKSEKSRNLHKKVKTEHSNIPELKKLKSDIKLQESEQINSPSTSIKTEESKITPSIMSSSPEMTLVKKDCTSNATIPEPVTKVVPKTTKEIPPPVRVSARQKERKAAAEAKAEVEKAKLNKSAPELSSKKGVAQEKSMTKQGKKASPTKELKISPELGKQAGQQSQMTIDVKSSQLLQRKFVKEVTQDKLEPITLKLSKQDNPVIIRSSSLSPKKTSQLSPQNKTLGYTLKIGKDSTTLIPKDVTLSPKSRDSSPNTSSSELSNKVGYLIKDTGLTITPVAPVETHEQKLSKITLKLSKSGEHPEIKQEKSETWKAIQKLSEIDIVPVEKKQSPDNLKRKEKTDPGISDKKIKMADVDLSVGPSTSSNMSKLQGLLTQAPLNQADDTDEIKFVGFGSNTDKSPTKQSHQYEIGLVKQEPETSPIPRKRGRPRKITSPEDPVHSITHSLPPGLTPKDIYAASIQHQTLQQHLQQIQQPIQAIRPQTQEEDCSTTMFPVPLFDLSDDTYIEPTPPMAPILFPDQVQPEMIMRSARGRPIGRSRRPRGSFSMRGERGGPRGRPRGSRGMKRMMEEMEALSYQDMDEPITLDNIDSEMGPRVVPEHSGLQEKTIALLRKSIEGKKEMEKRARRLEGNDDINTDTDIDAKVKEMKEKIEAAYQAELKSPDKTSHEKISPEKTSTDKTSEKSSTEKSSPEKTSTAKPSTEKTSPDKGIKKRSPESNNSNGNKKDLSVNIKSPDKETKIKSPEKNEPNETKKELPELIPIPKKVETSTAEKVTIGNLKEKKVSGNPHPESQEEQHKTIEEKTESSPGIKKETLKRKLSDDKSEPPTPESSKRRSVDDDTTENKDSKPAENKGITLSLRNFRKDTANISPQKEADSTKISDSEKMAVAPVLKEEDKMDVDDTLVSTEGQDQVGKEETEPTPPPKPVKPRPKSKAEIKRIKREKDRIRREAKKLAALEALKAPPPNPSEEDTRMSAGDGSDDPLGIKKNRMEVGDPEGKEFMVEQIAEYQWPLQGGELYMIQEQISTWLGIKSFKRKYPDLRRRMVEMEERTYLCDSGLVAESMCDLGLTALSSSEVLDVMFQDFPDQYEELRKNMREKQARELINKQKEKKKFEQSLSKSDLKDAVIQQAVSWNQALNKSRQESRKCHLDLQTWTIQYPRSRCAKMSRPTPKVGNYPVALIPGQFCDYYRRYTPQELRYWPINTVLYGPLQPNEKHSVGGSDGSQSESEDSSSSDDSSDTSSEGTCEEDEKEKECKACSGRGVKKAGDAMVQCSQCGQNRTTATVWA